jgi:hypothetical protein
MFQIGDCIERIGPLVPQYMRRGVVTCVMVNKDGIEWLTEYQVDFGHQLIATFYEPQLRLVNSACEDSR